MAAQQGWCREYTQVSFRAWLLDQHHLGSMDSLNQILTSLGRGLGSVIELANSPDVGKQYDRETDAARQLGIFGAPTFVSGQEIFWGDDRLEEAVAWGAGQHPIKAGRHQRPGNHTVKFT